tara:strand:+ start:22 stop:495 length:474 start_codon:yes stop_codon:yes gene_type:complete
MVDQRRYKSKRGKRTNRRKTRRMKRSRVKRSRVKRSRVKRTKMKGGYPGEEMYNRFKNRIKVGDFIKPQGDGLVKNIDYTDTSQPIPSTMRFEVKETFRKKSRPDFGTKYLKISNSIHSNKLIKENDAIKVGTANESNTTPFVGYSAATHEGDAKSY